MKWHDIQGVYSDRIVDLRKRLQNDPYSVLGIVSSATDEEVKQAYRRLIIIYHPDRQGDFFRRHGEEVIKIVNAAYARVQGMRGK